MKGSPLKLIVGGCSDIGVVREENEDSLAIHEPSDPGVRARKGVLIALADGMGGLEEGSTASHLAVDAVVRRYYESAEPPRAALEGAVKDANRAIFEHSRGSAGGRLMGSTLTAIAIIDGYACVAQVGDSRAYCYRGGTIHQITRDHSLVRELVDMGRMEEASPHYALHRNVLTRGLGLREDVAVDLYEIQDLDDGDRILATSDGLHEIVRPDEMAQSIERCGTDVDGACRELVQMARLRGGPDNITVAIACLEGGRASRRPKGQGLLPRQARSALAAGWLLPIVLFASFAAGVILTLVVEAPAVDEETARRLRTEVQAALDEQRTAGSSDARRAARLKERLEGIQKLLENGGQRP